MFHPFSGRKKRHSATSAAAEEDMISSESSDTNKTEDPVGLFI